ncbi:MAG: DUF732 domain-containing protein [Mycobacterium sp.]
MPDNEQQDTELAPTEQASTETTELPTATHAAEHVQAWSLADTAEVDTGSGPRGWLVSVGLVGLVVVVAGALIFLATTLFGSRSPKPVEPKAQPTTTVPVAAPPPPPAVTATATPPPTVTVTAAAPPAPALSSTDQQFLTALQNNGLSYPDPDYAISHAHATCDFMVNHRVQSGSHSAADYVARTTIWTDEYGQGEIFAMYSAFNYCPQSQSE